MKLADALNTQDEKKEEQKKKDKRPPLFLALDGLFNKKTPDKYPSQWILNRFLAWDPDFANAAREIQRDVWGLDISYRVWQGVLPALPRAPRLRYVGIKKQTKAEGLVASLIKRMHVRRAVAEQMVDLIQLEDKLDAVCAEFGVETK